MAGDGAKGAWEFSGGRWVAGGSVPLADRAVRYGMSIFETITIFGGRAILSVAHFERLACAAKELGWSDPQLPDALPEAAGCGLVADGVLTED